MSKPRSSRQSFRASQMSVVLIGCIVALSAILLGGSALAGSILLKKATAATHAQIDADVSASDTTRLEALKEYLAKNSAGISQTEALTAGLGQYDQNSIVATVSGYAAKSGVTIASFDFGSGATASPTAGASTAPGSVNVTLASPVSYQKFIVFLRLVEQGLMPAQVTSAQISADGDNTGNVTVSSLTIQVAQ